MLTKPPHDRAPLLPRLNRLAARYRDLVVLVGTVLIPALGIVVTILVR